MGIYLNPGTIEFQESINSEIYVDKTMLIERTNAALRTKQKYMCISRPRRYGKSMAADMLAAYYGKDYDSAALFDGLEISHCETFSIHLNKYNVCVRAGNHCAKILKNATGVTNTLRVSLFFYNTEKEIDEFVELLKNKAKIEEEMI